MSILTVFIAFIGILLMIAVLIQNPKGGGVDHGPKIFQQPTCHHAPEVYGGILEIECGQILKDFFQAKRLD